MSDLALILAVAAITYASRASFLLRPAPAHEGRSGPFLRLFPLALFVALATVGLVAPDGEPAVTPALAGGAGAVVGAIVTRRSLVGVVVVGAGFFYLVRWLVG